MPRHAPHPRPLSADFTPSPQSPSMLYSLLPTAVRARLPRLPSLRRSVSMYGLPARGRSFFSAPASGARTPEMGVGNALVLSGGVEEDLYFTDGSEEEDVSGRAPRGQRQLVLDEGKSGIVWKYANQGLSLLSLAVEESSTLSQDPRLGNASFARQLYIHALTYLLRALPSDLTIDEQLSVRSALPPDIVAPLRLAAQPAYASSVSPASPSVLHRTLAGFIVQGFMLLHFALPYVKNLLRAAYAYDREHKLAERVLRGGIEMVDGVGQRSVGVVGVLCGMGDGSVGRLVGEAVGWVAEGVTGGIHEGVGEGLAILGARASVVEGVRAV